MLNSLVDVVIQIRRTSPVLALAGREASNVKGVAEHIGATALAFWSGGH
ncbi:hypothetical protein [Methylobacterium gnaphalii]|uniref:Uncharacterized protein n=1 Tax=Methylobacterium gnaphalii TaxID=1010610 RepID=A0A512JRW6_9HYPH|nr:hypothetical protein [Methylobacterium gnaphalii]GEP12707.1 hypothetical protein MGN01_45520 [Methylobacterium gnaphalii]GJD70883.1 hypothetical protein MMMDOFMJ_3837 [Methylobacterium gnaphalii]GLS50938.1 hypothetical protein GCM10007885_37920 [Methylobacterium gnaphalii]